MNKENRALFYAGFIAVLWFSLVSSQYSPDGLRGIISNMDVIVSNPFMIRLDRINPEYCLMMVSMYTIFMLSYFSERVVYRKGEEHGSATFADLERLNRKYADSDYSNNKIMTRNVRISLDQRKHMRNLNVLVCGGSGAGKTRFYCKPNILQANTSLFCLDPKGELKRSTQEFLIKNGYKVRTLDLINMDESYCYNPFCYLRDDNDVQRLVTNLFRSTVPKGSKSSDPFWDTAAGMLLMAIILYLKHEKREEEQNFSTVLEYLRLGGVDENNPDRKSELDSIFDALQSRDPDHIALKYYRDYHSGAGKTLKSIQITLASRLEKFNLEKVRKLTVTDEMDLRRLGEEKSAIFAVIPDNDSSFNFLVSILYTQLFQELFYIADNVYHGELPCHVHFIMDEFSNVSVPSEFQKILSTMRSRGISVSIILQNLAQLKARFRNDWESIIGNCDSFLYLGGNEKSTHKYVSELIGKQTITYSTYSRSKGKSGSFTTGKNISGRELMNEDEVRRLDNEKALLFIRGEKAAFDFKYDITSHPSYGFIIEDDTRSDFRKTSKSKNCEIKMVSYESNGNYFNDNIDNSYEILTENEF